MKPLRWYKITVMSGGSLRNAPCHCGSGRKYKKCCLPKEENFTEGFWEQLEKRKSFEEAKKNPLVACYVNPSWTEHGLANVVLAREYRNGQLLIAVFLVDTKCLGVKDVILTKLSDEEFGKAFLHRVLQNEKPLEISIEYARELIFGAIQYAADLGFDPHPDFEIVRDFLGELKDPPLHNFSFGGEDGKPLYVPGPEDSVGFIFKKLIQRCGKDGFNYILGRPEESRALEEALEEKDEEEKTKGNPFLSRWRGLFTPRMETYRNLRQIGKRVNSRVIETLPRDLIFQAARDLGLRVYGNQIEGEAETDCDFIFDRAIHDLRYSKKRWIEIFWESHHSEFQGVAKEFLQANLAPTFSLYEVLDVKEEEGLLLQDCFSSCEFFVTDSSLGSSAVKGSLFATRILHVHSFHITAGIICPFPSNPIIQEEFLHYFSDRMKQRDADTSWENLMREEAPHFFKEWRRVGSPFLLVG